LLLLSIFNSSTPELFDFSTFLCASPQVFPLFLVYITTMANESHHIDWELMRLTADGDTAAFKQLVEKYQRAVINLAYRFLGNREEAEDIAQEVFIRVYQAARKYKPQAGFSTYLFRIATNMCLNELRHHKVGREIPFESSSEDLERSVPMEAPAPVGTQPDVQLEQGERNRLIQESLEALPSNQRMAVILKRFGGLSYLEIAEVLNTSVSAVESLLFRAKQTLKNKLKAYVNS
jgi:RNA polymerase sigma-70 factor (ECF subfamily)